MLMIGYGWLVMKSTKAGWLEMAMANYDEGRLLLGLASYDCVWPWLIWQGFSLIDHVSSSVDYIWLGLAKGVDDYCYG